MNVCLVVCDLEISTIRRPRPDLACCAGGGIVLEAVSLSDFASGFLHQISKLGFTCFSVLRVFFPTVTKLYISKESERMLMMAFV